MIYLFFSDLNPLAVCLLICPLISIIVGYFSARFHLNLLVPIVVAFLLPLLFITIDLATFKANLDAWLLYGILYVFISYVIYKMVSKLKKS